MKIVKDSPVLKDIFSPDPVGLTDKGRSVVKDVPDALQQRFVGSFERMQDWEQAQLLSSLERVAAMLDAEDIDASPVLAAGDFHATPKPQ